MAWMQHAAHCVICKDLLSYPDRAKRHFFMMIPIPNSDKMAIMLICEECRYRADIKERAREYIFMVAKLCPTKCVECTSYGKCEQLKQLEMIPLDPKDVS